ncbi:MAG TPA: GNAT family N-acetyltransferase [Acidimicrobiales bacterium]|nr:GNAT family N-acetyltransferase [Acidimicrobiales bacterium]
MPQLQRLRHDHAPQVLAFELANRTYFATFVSDRGDDFFAEFTERLAQRVAEQEKGSCAFYVLVDDDGSVLGRFNLVDIGGGVAELGYRVAERVAGRGVATAGVVEMCRVASQTGVHTLRARVALENVASQRVLVKAGFAPAGVAKVAGRVGMWYELPLTRRSTSRPST